MKLGDTRYFDGWSPDSKHLAWNVPTQHGPRLEVGGVDGTRVNLGFIGGFGSFLGWSADGQQFAWIVGPRPDQLRTASTDGERLLTVDGLNIPIYVSLSPDGGYLAWAVKSVVSSDELELWVGDVGGEDQVKVTDGWLLNTGHPVWSPDSEHIAWISTEDTRTELWVSNANGKSHTKIADDAALAGWSPDSEYVAWIVTEDTRTELWVGSASG
ncbi:MAG: hypothetical protein OXM88_05435, partial [bacterium]|nr:hypothetical protein [bacterium]